LQPYCRGNGGKRNTLCVLNRLWNADKHREIHGVRAEIIVDVPEVYFKPNSDAGRILLQTLRFGARKDGAEIARVKLAPQGRDPQVKMNTQISVAVTFEDGSPALPNLKGMAQYVVDTIGEFERFF